MTGKPKASPATSALQQISAGVVVSAGPSAPFVNVTVASAWTWHDGQAHVTLESLRCLGSPDGSVRKDSVTTGHLVMSFEALLQLRNVLNAIEQTARQEIATMN